MTVGLKSGSGGGGGGRGRGRGVGNSKCGGQALMFNCERIGGGSCRDVSLWHSLISNLERKGDECSSKDANSSQFVSVNSKRQGNEGGCVGDKSLLHNSLNFGMWSSSRYSSDGKNGPPDEQ